MKNAIGGTLILAMILSLPGATICTAADTTEGAYRLGEIVVSAKPETGVESIGTVHRVTAREIRDQGARTLADALRLVPGVNIREGGQGTPRVDIRGFRTRNVLLFLNGIPVRDTADGQFDPTTIPADIISEIKVTTGGGSVLYGPGGNGGSIDIITKAGKKGLHGSIGGQAAEGDSYDGNASLSGGNKKADFFAAVNVMDRDKYPLSDDFKKTPYQDGKWRENSDWKRNSLFGNVGYNLSDKTRLGLTVSKLTGKNGIPPVTNYDPTDPFSKKPKYERIDDLDNSLVQLALDHKTEGPFDVRGWGFFSQSKVEDNRYDDSTYSTQDKKGAFHQNADIKIFGANSQIAYHAGKTATATLGLSAENDSWNSDGFNVVGKKNDVQDFSDNQDIQVYSAALEYVQDLGKRAGIVLGYAQHLQKRDGNGCDNDFSYLVGANYDLTDTTRLRINHSRKIRFPSIKQLYDQNGGNEDLNTEVTLNYEAGIRQELPAGTTLELTGFITQAKNFIEKNADGVYTNYQKLRFAGVESVLTMRPVEALMLRLAATWLDTKDESDDSQRQELQYRPEWTLIAESRYRFNFGLTAFASLRYVANQYFYADNTDPLEKKKLNDFTVVNLRLSQKIFKTGLNIYAGADNLFDENYEESYGLPQPGRTIYGGVEYRF
jgi:vitamin B12 transporter